MEFSTDKKTILSAVNAVQKALPTRTALEVLMGIYLKVEGGTLTIRTTDLEVGIEYQTEVNVTAEGEAVVNGKLFCELIKKVPDVLLNFELQTKGLKVGYGDSMQTLQTWQAEEYPEFPGFEGENLIVIPNIHRITDMLGFAISTDSTKPVFNGVMLNGKKAYASDTFRLAVIDAQVDGLEGQLIIPGKLLAELDKLATDKVEMSIQGNQAVCKLDEQVTVYGTLLGEQYPELERIFPKSYATTMSFEKNELFRAIERASIFGEYVTLDIQPDSLTITSQDQGGDSKEVVKAVVEGEPLKIIFNAKFLTDALKVTEAPVLRFTSPTRAALMEEADFKYIVLPIKPE